MTTDPNALDESDVDQDELEMLKIIKTIFNRCESNKFSSFHIAFDPKDYLESEYEKAPKWAIPDTMYEKPDGTEILVEDY